MCESDVASYKCVGLEYICEIYMNLIVITVYFDLTRWSPKEITLR